ncbi:MAG: FAD-dependent thymidylate synthase [bacterium]
MDQKAEKLTRQQSPKMNDILGKSFNVLDDGFIRVIDYMGTDSSIVQAARVSYGKGTRKLRQDRSLIRYLMRHHHTSPFEMCEIKLHVRVPMDTWRQWIRHRTANVNEYSTRYSVAIDAALNTKPENWRQQAKINRQGSGKKLDSNTGEKFTQEELKLHELSRITYEHRINAGIAREQARKDLPLCTYTEAYWKIDLHNLLHFLALRMHPTAQHEIRSYANIIGHEIVRRWCPLTWEAFLDYRINSLIFSENELSILQALIQGNHKKAKKIADDLGWLPKSKKRVKKDMECREFEEKLNKLGLEIPWNKKT